MHKDAIHFFDHWSRIKETLKGRELFLFLDYDGTLTPIVEDPAQAVLAPDTKTVLDGLSRNEDCHVIVISGRSLSDLQEKVGLKKVIYVGNHGFEISGPQVRFENSCFPQFRKIFHRILEELKPELTAMPEIFIEDKRITASIHVRRLDPARKPLFKRTLQKITRPYVQSKEIMLREGKEVYELRPAAEWDKGRAALWLIKDRDPERTVSIYIGDDQTDEDAFLALKDSALTIHVGDGRTAAKYFLENPDQVKTLLAEIVSHGKK